MRKQSYDSTNVLLADNWKVLLPDNCTCYSYTINLLSASKVASIYVHTIHISLGMLVPNSRDQQGKLWLLNSLENNLTITYPSNIGHKSLSTELLAPWIYSSSLEFTKLKLSNHKNFNLTLSCLITLIDLLPKLVGI